MQAAGSGSLHVPLVHVAGKRQLSPVPQLAPSAIGAAHVPVAPDILQAPPPLQAVKPPAMAPHGSPAAAVLMLAQTMLPLQ